MPYWNKTSIMGNLVAENEVKYANNGETAILKNSIAINRKYKTQNKVVEEVDYIPFTAFGKSAELIAKYTSKGDCLLVEGRLKQESWKDKESGDNRYKLNVILENFQFINTKKKGTEAESSQAVPAGAKGTDDDVPF